VDYRLTHKQSQDRDILRDLIGDARAIGGIVVNQPNLNPGQRKALEQFLGAANQLVKSFDMEAGR
jgi:hypothetical protein